MTTAAQHAELFKRLYADRVLAHEIIFRHRRKNLSQPFHRDMILDWHDREIKHLLELAFRGSAKSTIAEEAVLLRAGFREFRNGLVIGETSDRAIDRVRAIKHEVETNEALHELFGDLRGPVWGEGELEFSNGARILALGRGQALRGIKHHDMRPDAIFCDDIENKQSVSTVEGRRKAKVWFSTELLPACDPTAFIRMAATPLDPDALAVHLARSADWVTRVYPIEYVDPEGVRKATWPDRFPLAYVDAKRDSMTSQGLSGEFAMEYLCTAVSRESQLFRSEYIRVEPTVRTWQPVYAMFDPARTTNTKSAMTGYACWSWIGPRLVVWDAWGKFLLPDAIVSAVFDCADAAELPPVWIGVEEDGLNEFLLQPIRQEQVRRGQSIPFRAMRAPRGKADFIRGLQPFFKAGEVTFVKDMHDLKSQLLSFPTGRVDVPNALAYALKMRPGMPIFDNFSGRHVFEGLRGMRGTAPWLAVNATRSLTTAALVQYQEGNFFVLGDWVREGPPADVLSDILASAQIEAGRTLNLAAAPGHFDFYHNVGLTQAAARVPVTIQRSTPAALGAPALSSFMQRDVRGFPAFRVSTNARWTLNALAGGYTRGMKNGIITDQAEDGPYKVLMEGIESFAGLTAAGSLFGEDDDRHYDTTASGRTYLSARR